MNIPTEVVEGEAYTLYCGDGYEVVPDLGSEKLWICKNNAWMNTAKSSGNGSPSLI